MLLNKKNIIENKSAIEDAKLAGGGNGWVLDVISQNRDSAREKCYEVINKYM